MLYKNEKGGFAFVTEIGIEPYLLVWGDSVKQGPEIAIPRWLIEREGPLTQPYAALSLSVLSGLAATVPVVAPAPVVAPVADSTPNQPASVTPDATPSTTPIIK